MLPRLTVSSFKGELAVFAGFLDNFTFLQLFLHRLRRRVPSARCGVSGVRRKGSTEAVLQLFAHLITFYHNEILGDIQVMAYE